MNIFDLYLIKIKDILKDLSKQNKIILPQNLEGITAEIPPVKFDSDISTNVAMFLAKINKKTPNDIAEILSPILSDNDKQIERISIEKPGFINIKFKPIFWTNFIKDVIENYKSFGVNKKEKNKLFDRICICQSNWTITRRSLSRCYFRRRNGKFVTVQQS